MMGDVHSMDGVNGHERGRSGIGLFLWGFAGVAEFGLGGREGEGIVWAVGPAFVGAFVQRLE